MSRPKVRRGYLPAGSEAAFQQAVVQLLGYAGWTLLYHTHNSERSAPGFPDVVAVHGVRPWILFAELKSAKPSRRATLADIARRAPWLQDRAVTNDQAAWLAGLARVAEVIQDAERLADAHASVDVRPRLIVKLWRDDDDGWADIEATLGARRGQPGAGNVRPTA